MMEHLPFEKWTPVIIARDPIARDLMPGVDNDIS